LSAKKVLNTYYTINGRKHKIMSIKSPENRILTHPVNLQENQSERHSYHESYTMLMGGRLIQIVEPAGILNVNYLEDIMNTHRSLNIRLFGIHQI